jgi:hypothetical protein
MDLSFCCWESGVASGARLGAAAECMESLADNGWSGGALEIVVAADPGAAHWMDNEQKLGQALDATAVAAAGGAPPAKEQFDWRDQLPSQQELAKVFGQFPTKPVSERKRRGGPESDNELYSRVTVRFTNVPALNKCLKSDELDLFDLVAVRPLNQAQFSLLMDLVQAHGPKIRCDIVSLVGPSVDGSPRRTGIKVSNQDMVKLRAAQVFVELNVDQVCAGPTPQSRRVALQQVRLITEYVSRGHLKARGKYSNVILSGSNCGAVEKMTPDKLVVVGGHLGLRERDSQAAVTTACQAALERAQRRRRAGSTLCS